MTHIRAGRSRTSLSSIRGDAGARSEKWGPARIPLFEKVPVPFYCPGEARSFAETAQDDGGGVVILNPSLRSRVNSAMKDLAFSF